jgi:hypothetical protein
MCLYIRTDLLDSKAIIKSCNATTNPTYMDSNVELTKYGVLSLVNDVHKALNYKIMVNCRMTQGGYRLKYSYLPGHGKHLPTHQPIPTSNHANTEIQLL